MNTLVFSIRFFVIILSVRRSTHALRNLATCQDHLDLKPADGLLLKNTFGWLGFMQYRHVTTELPYQSKAPRVIMIHKHFVLGTAVDLLHLPKNYKLGNVIFGEYERVEDECGISLEQLKMGVRCPDAYLEMPFVDITPHPEYSRFGIENSLALVKLIRPIKSDYMLPICLPSIRERNKKLKNKSVFIVDYINSVPRELDAERMGKKTLKLYTHNECYTRRSVTSSGNEGMMTHVLCSTGCGVRAGTPIVSHNAEGPFELIGIAAGSAPCVNQSMRRRLTTDPPFYIDVYPYNTWITNFITAYELPLAYPQNFRRTDSGSSIGMKKDHLRSTKTPKFGWRGRTFMAGNYCFKSDAKLFRRSSVFYHERFDVISTPLDSLTVQLKVSAGIECTIVCARLNLPNRFVLPSIEGIGRYNITIEFATLSFPTRFTFTLMLFGKNTTRANFEAWVDERSEGHW